MNLYTSGDSAEWKRMLEQYDDVLKVKAEKSRKKQQMIELDKWFQDELPSAVMQRDPQHVTRDELIKLMEWKLTRGRFRPRLGELVKGNSDELVIDISKKALQKVAVNLKEAIKELTKLKAVGPATASAVLCAGAPHQAPFLADESAAAVSGLGKVDYTMAYYLDYAKRVCEKAKELDNEDPDYGWDAHKVELSLWTAKTAEQLGFNLKGKAKETRKRKKTDSESSRTSKRQLAN